MSSSGRKTSLCGVVWTFIFCYTWIMEPEMCVIDPVCGEQYLDQNNYGYNSARIAGSKCLYFGLTEQFRSVHRAKTYLHYSGEELKDIMNEMNPFQFRLDANTARN